ncbi:MAG: ATP-binding cassette domain-containing protein, partial [Candidatus Omnitrophica bacterium]|nr:ATP-binding cassette domain-containing protein [Candidatus Omnitrophota bacterium]
MVDRGEVFEIKGLDIWFGAAHVLRQVSLDVRRNEILGVIGPSNSGKTTFLRTLNRLNDLAADFKMSGKAM